MGIYIKGMGAILLSVFVLVTMRIDNQIGQYDMRLKITATHASHAAVNFEDRVQYGEGFIVFNQPESIQAIDAVIKTELFLDDTYNQPHKLFGSPLTYEYLFYDDSNQTFPYTYTDAVTGYTDTMGGPSVVVRINAGPATRLLFGNTHDIIRVSSYEYNENR